MLDKKSVKAVEVILKSAIESSERIEKQYSDDPVSKLAYQVGTLQGSINFALLYLKDYTETA